MPVDAPANAFSKLNIAVVCGTITRRIQFMVDNRVRRVADLKTGLADSAGKLRIFTKPRSARTKSQVEQPYSFKNLTLERHVGAGQALNDSHLLAIVTQWDVVFPQPRRVGWTTLK